MTFFLWIIIGLACLGLIFLGLWESIKGLLVKGLLTLGNRAFLNEKHEKAYRFYKWALAVDPLQHKAQFHYASIFFIFGEFLETTKFLNKILRSIETLTEVHTLDHADLFYLRGRAYYERKRFNHAIKDFNQVLQINPDTEDAFIFRGLSYLKNDSPYQAIRDFNLALEYRPADEDLYIYRGIAYREAEDYDNSLADFNHAIKLAPKDAEIVHFRGCMYFQKGELENALNDFNFALKNLPDYAEAWFHRGMIFEEYGQFDRAFTHYQKALELRPEEYVYQEALDRFKNKK